MKLKENPLKTSLVKENTLKTDDRIIFFGVCDELSAYIMDLSNYVNKDVCDNLRTIVPILSKIMGMVAGASIDFKNDYLEELILFIKKYKTSPDVLTSFVLPGTNKLSSKTHIVRTVARRCELSYAKVYEKYGGDDLVFEYLNKLSTLFYELALYLEKEN